MLHGTVLVPLTQARILVLSPPQGHLVTAAPVITA